MIPGTGSLLALLAALLAGAVAPADAPLRAETIASAHMPLLAEAVAPPGAPLPGLAGHGTRHVVEMRAFAFAPAELEVEVGDTVVWLNRDPVPHTASDSLGAWDSGTLAAGARWTWVARAPGRVSYLCALHPAMRAVLTVRARPAP